MSKIKEQLLENMMINPEHYNNPDPTQEEMEIPEPTDAELAAIEADFEALDSWKADLDDIMI